MTQSEEKSTASARPGNGNGADSLPDNVIILTGGLTGSSALAGLLSAAGFWSGEDTFRKRDYNTYENSELIRLNRAIMSKVGIGEEYTKYYLPDAIEAIADLKETDESPYRRLIETCEMNRPWLWKDPRLWLTIRFWQRFLPEGRCRFLLLERDLRQAWISMTQRRAIQSWKYTRRYHEGIQGSLRGFLSNGGSPYMSILFEDLMVQPELELNRLSDFLDTPVTMNHLKSTYKGPLYKKSKGARDAIEAGLIYLKNYRERLR